MKYCSMPFSLIVGSHEIYLDFVIRLKKFGKVEHLLCGNIGFKFLPISVQALHSLDLPIYLGGYMATKFSLLGTTLQSFQDAWNECSPAQRL